MRAISNEEAQRIKERLQRAGMSDVVPVFNELLLNNNCMASIDELVQKDPVINKFFEDAWQENSRNNCQSYAAVYTTMIEYLAYRVKAEDDESYNGRRNHTADGAAG